MERNIRTGNRIFLNQKFESVQSLRGIAALFVVMQHICFLQRGAFGVELFFIISGFIMMFVTEKSTEHFLAKRLLRIIPLYYAMTIVSFGALLIAPSLFEQTTASPVYLVKSLLFLPFSLGGVTQPLLRVGWTVNYELLFYLLFFLSMKLSFRFRAFICSGILLILTGIGILFPQLPEPFAFWTDSILLEFAAGLLLFYPLRAIYERGACSKAAAWGMLAASAALFAFEWWSAANPALCALPRVLRWGIPSVLIFVMVFYAGGVTGMPKWLVKLGDMSFSLYLLHYYPMRLLNKYLENTGRINLRSTAAALTVLAVTLIASALCYELIEVRLTGRLRRRLKNVF